MNRYRQFQRLVGQARRTVAEVVSVRADGTSVVQTPEGRIWRVQGGGVPAGSQAYIRFRPGEKPQIDGPAPDLPAVAFTNL